MANNSTISPLQVFDPNGLNDFITNIKTYIFSMIGISLNTLILIISIKKERKEDDTYRIIILYQVIAAMVEDTGRITRTILLSNLFSGCQNSIVIFNYFLVQFIDYLMTKVPVLYDVINDITTLFKTFGQLNFVLLIPLFSINRFLAIVFPTKFSIHMTARRVHIYCITITVLIIIGFVLNELTEYVNFGTKFVIDAPEGVCAIVAIITLFIIPPITSIWVMGKLLLHLRVLNNLHEKKRMIDVIFISFALLIEGTYAFMSTLPFCVLLIWASIDEASLFTAYYTSSLLNAWIYWGIGILLGVTDTTFYALNIIINIRVYSAVVFRIPIAIYRRLFSKNSGTKMTAVAPMTQTRMRNNTNATAAIGDRVSQLVKIE